MAIGVDEFVMVVGNIDSPPCGLNDGSLLLKLWQKNVRIHVKVSPEQASDLSTMWTLNWDNVPPADRKPFPAFFSYCYSSYDAKSAEKVLHVKSKSFNM